MLRKLTVQQKKEALIRAGKIRIIAIIFTLTTIQTKHCNLMLRYYQKQAFRIYSIHPPLRLHHASDAGHAVVLYFLT